jgi:hypothetical protein
MGAIVAFFKFFLGSFIIPGGFGFSRWVYACIDVVALPVALPYAICLIFAIFRIIPPQSNFTNYAFLWLIPVAAVRALSWSSLNDPILLMGVPVLWTSVVVGMGLLIRLIQNGWGWAVIPAFLGAVALPLVAATAYWALFGHSTTLGIILMILTAVPAVISLIYSFIELR